jgi:hypothetical protein
MLHRLGGSKLGISRVIDSTASGSLFVPVGAVVNGSDISVGSCCRTHLKQEGTSNADKRQAATA